MSNNVIKRSSTELKVEFLQEAHIKRYGQFATLKKDECGRWTCQSLDGFNMVLPSKAIRNSEILKIIEQKEVQ